MKEKESMSYRQILDETNQLIQISRMEDFTMLYANLPARGFAGNQDIPYEGEKCYQYMMGLKEQCLFCPMRSLQEEKERFEEIDNGNQVFTVKTKRITWEGEDAFIEYATDITAVRRAQEIFQTQMQRLVGSIPEAQGIFHLNLTKDRCISMNGVSANLSKLDDTGEIDLLMHQIASFIPNEKMQERYLAVYERKALIEAYQKGKSQVEQELLSYYEDKSIRWTRMTARLLMNPQTGDLECILYGMDINEEKLFQEMALEAEREKEILLEQTKKDLVTGLYTKQAFLELTEEYRKKCPEEPFALVFLDLDRFKDVNDTLGHLSGDRVLIDMAQRLQTSFSNKDVVARFGGDEFCVLVKAIPEKTMRDRLEFLLRTLAETYSDGKKKVRISASIGVIYCEHTTLSVTELLEKADNALYAAKESGRNRYSMIVQTEKRAKN